MPETKIGVCPWCGEETMLFFTMGFYRGGLEAWTDFICGGCLEKARRLGEETEDGKQSV